MTKISVAAGVLLTAGLLLVSMPIQADDEVSAELQKVRDTVSEKFAEIGAENVFESPIDGWFTVRKGAIIAYISADSRYLLQGDLIDLENNTNLSEQARNDARAIMMSAVSDEEVIIFTPDEVEHTVSVFTDIDCTFCRRLHAQIDQYMEQGIEIRYFLYPRNGPTSASWAKAENVWCANDRNEALTLAKLDEEYPTHTCDASIVSTHYAIGQDVGLRGTPAIVLDDGTLFSGYLPPEKLKQAIIAAGR
ncbi:MAG: DsbC family protein [Gammaproteobacteria bacterium]|nr:DsbC family protein [Gammaproteobacteria bacterium]